MGLFTILIIAQGEDFELINSLSSLTSVGGDWSLLILGPKRNIPQELEGRVRFLELASQLSPGEARNRAIMEIKNEWVLFLGEDTYVGPQYFETVIPLLVDPKIEVLGGPLLPSKRLGAASYSLGLALTSPFCTGATFARHQGLGKKMVSADEERLSISNLWMRRALFNETGFPPDYHRGEEILLLQELKARGTSLFYHPKLSAYQKLSTSPQEFFWEGFYRSKLMRRKISVGQEVFWLPSIFVLLHLMVFVDREVFWSMVKLYGGIIGFVSLGLSMKSKRPWLFPLVAFMHYFVVFCYGLGFLAERVKLMSLKGR